MLNAGRVPAGQPVGCQFRSASGDSGIAVDAAPPAGSSPRRTRVHNHIRNLFQTANLKLDNVASDPMGSYRTKDYRGDDRGPGSTLQALPVRKLQIAEFEARIDEHMRPYAVQIEKLSAIPGVDRIVASVSKRMVQGNCRGSSQMLIWAFQILETGQPYQDLGDDYFDQSNPTRTTRKLLGRLEKLGWNIQLTPRLKTAYPSRFKKLGERFRGTVSHLPGTNGKAATLLRGSRLFFLLLSGWLSNPCLRGRGRRDRRPERTSSPEYRRSSLRWSASGWQSRRRSGERCGLLWSDR